MAYGEEKYIHIIIIKDMNISRFIVGENKKQPFLIYETASRLLLSKWKTVIA
jgi:hypothetical protein